MNLITRFTLAFVLVAAVVFVGGGFISYQVVKKEIQSEEKRFLKSRYKRLLKYLETRTRVDGFTRNKTILELVTMYTPLYGLYFQIRWCSMRILVKWKIKLSWNLLWRLPDNAITSFNLI